MRTYHGIADYKIVIPSGGGGSYPTDGLIASFHICRIPLLIYWF